MLCLALTNIFSQYKFMVGEAARTMTLCEWLATVLACLALWTYNVEPEVRADDSGSAETQVLTLPGSMLSDGRSHLIETLSFYDKDRARSRSMTLNAEQRS